MDEKELLLRCLAIVCPAWAGFMAWMIYKMKTAPYMEDHD